MNILEDKPGTKWPVIVRAATSLFAEKGHQERPSQIDGCLEVRGATALEADAGGASLMHQKGIRPENTALWLYAG